MSERLNRHETRISALERWQLRVGAVLGAVSFLAGLGVPALLRWIGT